MDFPCRSKLPLDAMTATAEHDFANLASRHPDMYRTIAQELARRLMPRNALVGAHRERICVFIISSAEAMPIAREIQEAFAHDAILPALWTDGVFRATHDTYRTSRPR
ncbi:hypothetical protein [Microvirga sp. VF16]|uniref:hypothetical protein n=1 Tax=Microvirga sp. VF16 TaxID=2807101 RepID=UPI00193D00A3|nr:hypothetical protein [Microvirga sp. VF16]QRM33131.1 hypothetical protein JO965_27975 [Microvirga sp. VF16]